MMPVVSYEEYLRYMREKSRNENFVSCIMFLDKNYETPICEEILKSIKDFHERSGSLMTFFLPGYDADILETDYPHIDFYREYFNAFIRDLEQVSTWSFGEGPELLFLNMIDGELDFSRVYDYRLNEIIGKGNLNTFHILFAKFKRSLQMHGKLRLGRFAAARITAETAEAALNTVAGIFKKTLPSYRNLEGLGTLLPKDYSKH